LEDRRISAKSIAEQLRISRERVGSIIREDVDVLLTCFLPGRAKDLSAPVYSPKEGKINKERRKKKWEVSKKSKTQNRNRKNSKKIPTR
jgi:hypothetical protein